MVEVNDAGIEVVGEVGAARAGAERIVRAEHGVVDDRLRAAGEELGMGAASVFTRKRRGSLVPVRA